MRTRIISGVALIVIVVVTLPAGEWPFLLLILLAAMLATHEFYGIAQQGGFRPAYYVGMAAAFALMVDIAFAGGGYTLVILAATLILATVAQSATLRQTLPHERGKGRGEGQVTLSSDQLRQSWLNIAFTVGGVLYIAWLLRLGWLVYEYCRPTQPCQSHSFVFGLQIGPGVWWIILALVATTFADSGAYFIGRRFGRRKLIPWISPAKTVEGLFGGIAAATLGVLLLIRLVDIAWYNALILGPLLALVSVGGDLIESMFKRAMQVKDSGDLIPGHGGVLDRIDSIITTIVAVFLYITYAQFLFAQLWRPYLENKSLPRFNPLLAIVGRIVLWLLFHSYLFAIVKGRENIPRKGPVILIANHISYLDPLLVGWAILPRLVHYLAKIELFENKFISFILHGWGCIPVDRDRFDRNAITASLGLLRQSHVLGLFPEGTRSSSGEMLQMRGGAVRFAVKERCVLLPIGVIGTDKSFPRGAKFPKPALVRVNIGQPFELTEFYDGPMTPERTEAAITIMREKIAALL